MGGQIVDATIVSAPKQRNTEDEKRALREGHVPEDWAAKPAKLRRDARWTVKYSDAKPSADGAKRVDIAVPMFGYKNHVGIGRRHGLIRTWTASDAAPHDGAQLPGLLDKANTASAVWADTAYRSAKKEVHLAANGFRSRIHRKKPQGKPMPKDVSRANAAKSEVRAHVEHVFARQKGPMALVIRTVGLARATVKIGLGNLAYNMLAWSGSPEPPRPDRPSAAGIARVWPPDHKARFSGTGHARHGALSPRRRNRGYWRCPAAGRSRPRAPSDDASPAASCPHTSSARSRMSPG
jgi:hypothetical protein